MKTQLFATAHQLLLETTPEIKVLKVAQLFEAALEGNLVQDEDYPVSQEVIGGLPVHLALVDPKAVKRRRLSTQEGKAALIHALAHIEFNAINIALDAIYRFREMPFAYYQDWLQIAAEEAYHFSLLSQHLSSYGHVYGDFPAHGGLWEMVQKTAEDVLIRMALVPRLLEARGLDVTPDIAHRLQQANDEVGAEILKIIFHDELNHVRVGNIWYYRLCEQRKLNPQQTFLELLKRYAPAHLRGPIAVHHRLRAGFEAAELDMLVEMIKA